MSQTATIAAPVAYKSAFNRWVYETLPSGMKVATLSEFTDSRGIEIPGIIFLVHSYHSNHFEVHTSKPGVIEKFMPWIADGRVYVKQ
jgi:hypothetical protein